METDFCSHCYAPADKLLRCGQCLKRRYCSKECQRLDWKQAGHKLYCGVSGELGVDFEIREAENDKGVGVFALKRFHKDDKIMVERPILTVSHGSRTSMDQIVPSARPAVEELLPCGGSLQDKIRTNGMSCTDDDDSTSLKQTGLFIVMSRVNHNCLGNAAHRYLENRSVKILVANCDIEEGEEITISYVHGKSPSERRSILGTNYGFVCDCPACTVPEIEADFERMKELDDAILTLGSLGKVEVAMRKGKALLQLYDKYNMTSWLYHRTYYELYQVSITKRKSFAEGVQYIRKAYEYCLAFTSDPQNPSVRKMKAYVDSPRSHRNYMILE